MGQSYESNFVFKINNIKDKFQKKTRNLNVSLSIITEKDEKELKRLSEVYINKIRYGKDKKIRGKVGKFANAGFIDELNEIFDLIKIKEPITKEEIDKKIKELREKDLILDIKESKCKDIQDLANDEFIKILMKNESFKKLLMIMNDYIDYVTEVICMFIREVNTYLDNLIYELGIKENKTKIALNLSQTNNECKNIVNDFIELQERRNIIEHHNSVISEKYVKHVKTSHIGDVGKVIFTQPGYISKAYGTVFKYLLVITTFILKNNNVIFDIKKVKKIFKEEKNLYDFVFKEFNQFIL